jgi:hypothetical protein
MQLSHSFGERVARPRFTFDEDRIRKARFDSMNVSLSVTNQLTSGRNMQTTK